MRNVRTTNRGGLGTGYWPEAPGYASSRPGSATIPDSSGHNPTEQVNLIKGLFGLVVENWLPFSAWITNRFMGPRAPSTAFASPYDVGLGEANTRFGTFPAGARPFPYPYEIGAVDGFMPMMDGYSMAFAYGKTPSGPGVATPVPVPFDAQYPTMPKVSG